MKKIVIFVLSFALLTGIAAANTVKDQHPAAHTANVNSAIPIQPPI